MWNSGEDSFRRICMDSHTKGFQLQSDKEYFLRIRVWARKMINLVNGAITGKFCNRIIIQNKIGIRRDG